MIENKRGLSEIVLILIVVVVIGLIGFFVYRNSNTIQEFPEKVENTESNGEWKTYKNKEIGIEFSYPSEHEADLGKLGSFNFITQTSQDGFHISLLNNYGPSIDIYNNPERLSLDQIFSKREIYNIQTFAKDEKISIDNVDGLLRYEVWDLPEEIIVVHFVYEDKYFQITISPRPDEELAEAKKRLMHIIDSFKFTI